MAYLCQENSGGGEGWLFYYYYFPKLGIEKVKAVLREVSLALCCDALQINFVAWVGSAARGFLLHVFMPRVAQVGASVLLHSFHRIPRTTAASEGSMANIPLKVTSETLSLEAQKVKPSTFENLLNRTILHPLEKKDQLVDLCDSSIPDVCDPVIWFQFAFMEGCLLS